MVMSRGALLATHPAPASEFTEAVGVTGQPLRLPATHLFKSRIAEPPSAGSQATRSSPTILAPVGRSTAALHLHVPPAKAAQTVPFPVEATTELVTVNWF